MSGTVKYVHPFPARMAPDLAQDIVGRISSGAVVLDPMMGSGTFPIRASSTARQSIGVDSDPLALLIARASISTVDEAEVLKVARSLAQLARVGGVDWEPADSETSEFIDFWFDINTRGQLGRLANGIRNSPQEMRDILWCAFSRLIITKDAGVSRARDVSHSRPHRVREVASYPPASRYEAAVKTVLDRRYGAADLHATVPKFLPGDARALPLQSNSVDVVVTSPPYLNAIDYLRAHRMTLVWLGYSIADLRRLRAENIGTERGMGSSDLEVERIASKVVADSMSERDASILRRYCSDLYKVCGEVARVVKGGGLVTFIVANARMRGADVDIARIVALTGGAHGMCLTAQSTRPLPSSGRYLPPPVGERSGLGGRMREEHLLSFVNEVGSSAPALQSA